ncbi:tetraspanin-18 [Lucilia sericata]|uniref:tetraspanin-18 n=2 Tax=Lucilia sericata TaxID=13632 RepID=UPI0018A82D12|nr:tetraspanin-18 [Lucilia sericata]XP_037820282.1 tetraspanin-18 [Lucilia sericata]XP_037820283.1 tetraspanin-18 [Lucilia sericata]XP_037820284.1 tetraspanin-18 [Lucilia sericata]XP_037820285.1 tetraspanin-18 [Lucilia sericata]XP_037820286.1 tetraspanin-18 [Lucilia sericata]
MGSDCGVWIGKYVLCIFNFLFFILGTIVLGTGIWLAVDKASLIALLKMVESENINQFTQPQVIEQMAYVLIAIGGIMFLMSFLGYCGAIRESRCLLTTYGVFMILLLIAEIVAGGLAAFYKETARNESKGFLQSTITKYYTTAEHTDAVTLMWNQMMSTFGCCGVVDYRDFETSSGWLNGKGNHTIPEACCRLKDIKNLLPEDDSCVTNPNETNSFYLKGCYDVFTEWIISHREIIIAVLFGVGVVHLLAIFLAFCLCKSFAKYHGMRL